MTDRTRTGWWLSYAGATLMSVAFAIFVTWPQVLLLSSHVPPHQDPRFSMWRLAWIAHALRTAPTHLFDANIFHPVRDTLAFSDATLLEGVIAAPFLWRGFPIIATYNVLLLAGIAASGVAMFVLVRRLTGSAPPALVAATIFTLAPYRVEHVMHLELQWTMWIPLTWWAVHRAFDRGTWTSGLLAGVFLALQVISCVYYGVFLAMVVALMVPLLLVTDLPRARHALAPMATAAVTTALLTLPYLAVYARAARAVGGREPEEIARYSARAVSYLAAPDANWIWGWTDPLFGGIELRLFPGAIAVALAVLAVVSRPTRLVFVYAALTLAAIELSFGSHGAVYGFLISHVDALRGLRAWSRFGILVSGLIAVMAGFGYERLRSRFPRPAQQTALLAAVVALMSAEYANRPTILQPERDPHDVALYRVLRSAAPGAIVEFPLPHSYELPGHEAQYAFWSIAHWRPIVNGYSGYFPLDYLTTLDRLDGFPDERSIRQLRLLDVRFVIVHRAFMAPDHYGSLVAKMVGQPALKPFGRYADPAGIADVFTVEPQR